MAEAGMYVQNLPAAKAEARGWHVYNVPAANAEAGMCGTCQQPTQRLAFMCKNLPAAKAETGTSKTCQQPRQRLACMELASSQGRGWHF
jgi:hypothetical protein